MLLSTGSVQQLDVRAPSENYSTYYITATPGQAVTFNLVLVCATALGTTAPIPTGTVTLKWNEDAGTTVTVPLSGGSNAGYPGNQASASAQGTLTLDETTTQVLQGYGPIVYAEYSGDGNYPSYSSLFGGSQYYRSVGVNFPTQSKIAFIQQPSDVAVGDNLSPPITVAVENGDGSYDTSATDAITLSLASGSTGTGTLGGTLTESAVDGIATFSNVTVSATGNYTLQATDSSNSSTATSSSFNVSNGKLVFLPPPLASTQTAGKPLQPTIQVELKDGSGNAITSEDGAIVTLSLIGVNSANPITGNTATLTNGVATFSNVVLTKPGTYQLQASDPDGDAMGTSNKFGIGGDTLRFLVQPKNAEPNDALTVKVEALTPKGKIDATLADSIQLSLNVVSGGTNAVLAGTTTMALVGGIATFSTKAGVSINASGTYMLGATALTSGSTDYTVTNATSNSFSISAEQLKVNVQPKAAYEVLEPITMSVEIVNKNGKVDTTVNGEQTQLSLLPVGSANSVQLQGTITATFVNGVATFSDVSPNGVSITGAGTFKLTCTEIGTNDPAKPVNTRAIKIKGFELFPNELKFEQDDPLIYSTDRTPPTQLVEVFLEGQGNTPAPADLPNVAVKIVTPNGQASPSDGIIASPVASTATNNGQQVATATYDFNLQFQTVGTYHLQFDAVPTSGALIQPSAIESAKQTLHVKSPFIQIGTIPRIVANQSFTAAFSVDQPTVMAQLIHPVPGLKASVGVSVQLESSKFSGELTGTTIASATTGTVGPLTITAPGIYRLMFTEVQSPMDSTFDPSNVSQVFPTPVALSVPIRVLPDHLVFTQAPPKQITAGSPFSVSVALEDDNGNVLTDISGELTGNNGASFDETPVADISLFGLSTKKANDLANVAPVPFVNGVATFSNLVINTHGVFTIHISEQEQDPNGMIQLNQFNIMVNGTSNPFSVI